MNCNLCDKPIKNYNPAFSHLKIDESHAVEICQDCVDKFTMWQGDIITNLFPTKALKRRNEKNK